MMAMHLLMAKRWKLLFTTLSIQQGKNHHTKIKELQVVELEALLLPIRRHSLPKEAL
jgi:hypothetical protein